MSPPTSPNRSGGASPVASTFPAFRHRMGARSLPGPGVGCRAFCCLPCPPVSCGSWFPGLGCSAAMSWVNFTSALDQPAGFPAHCVPLTCLQVPADPAPEPGLPGHDCRLQPEHAVLAPRCECLGRRGRRGGSAVGRCLGARAREWRSGVAKACRARRAGLPVTQEISQTCPKCAGQSRAVSLFGRGVTPEEPGLEMAGGGPQEGQAVAQILALLRELF